MYSVCLINSYWLLVFRFYIFHFSMTTSLQTVGKRNYRKNRGKRIRNKEHCKEIKTGEHMEPREQAKRLDKCEIGNTRN